MKQLMILTAATACLLAFGLHYASEYKTAKSNYDKANVCTAALVAQGVERSDIIRNAGECEIKLK